MIELFTTACRLISHAHNEKKRTWGCFSLLWRKIGSLSLTCLLHLPISTVALVRNVRQSPPIAALLGSLGRNGPVLWDTACFPFYMRTTNSRCDKLCISVRFSRRTTLHNFRL